MSNVFVSGSAGEGFGTLKGVSEARVSVGHLEPGVSSARLGRSHGQARLYVSHTYPQCAGVGASSTDSRSRGELSARL